MLGGSFQVSEEDMEEMFTCADKDSDGKISHPEFQAMINPPKPIPESHTQNMPSQKRVTIKTSETDTF